MRPALLIVMMDFMVASLLLYVTEPGMPKNGMGSMPVAEVVSSPAESLWASVSEMERGRDAEMETYYKALLTASNEDEITSLMEKNRGLESSLQSQERRAEEATKEAQAERQRIAEASAKVEGLISEKSELHRRLGEKEEDIERYKENLGEKDRVIASMQRLNEKTVEDALNARQEVKTKRKELEEKTEQLLDAKKTLTEQIQKTEVERQKAERLEEGLDEQKKIKDELVASLLQKKQALSASEAEAGETRERLKERAAELEALNARLAHAEKEISEQEKRVMEARQARKLAEHDLDVEKVRRSELQEKIGDVVVQLAKDETERNQVTLKKLDNIENNQASTLAALKGMETKIDQMPEMFREGLREFIEENRKVLEKNDLLTMEIQNLVAAVDPQAARQMMTEIQALQETSRRIEEHLAGIKIGTSTEGMEQNMKALKDLSKKQRELQEGIDNRAATALARSKGIFAQVNDARLQIDGSLKAKGVLWGYNTREIKTYPVMVRAHGQVYAVSHAASIGIDWNKISDRIETVSYAMRTSDTSSSSLDDMYALPSNCKILILSNPGEGTSLDLYRSVSEIRERALGNLHIFRNSMRSSDIKIETGTTLNDSQKVLEFDRTLLGRLLSNSKNPEPGDFVVSSDGHLVGVMKDWKTCALIIEDDLSLSGLHIDFSSLRSFMENVRAYKSNCP